MYINPYKLLGIAEENISDVDSATINKAKRKLLSEIELSETYAIVHSGVELNKGDCLKAIDDLDNNNKKEFHIFIIQNKPLYNFLTSRDLTFFTQFQFESMYKDHEFLDFISPYFSEQYDQALFINFKKNISHNLKAILSVKPITNSEYSEKCYKTTYSFLREINNEFEKINKDIENNSGSFIKQNFQGLARTISDKVNVEQLNALPSYFQSIRNQIAHSIRDIEVKLYNDPYNNYTVAFQLIEFAKSINSDGLTLQTITKSYYTVKQNYEDEIKKEEEEKQTLQYSIEFNHYRNFINQFDKIIEDIENKNSTYISKKFSGLYEWITGSIDISDLNVLPDIFNTVRRRIAIQLKNLSVTIWNDHEKIEPAFKIIQLATQIKIRDEETKDRIIKDYNTLKNIDERNTRFGKPIKYAPSISTTNGVGTKIYDDTLYFVIFFIPIFPIARYSLEFDGIDSFKFFGKLKLHLWQKIWIYGLIGLIVFLFILPIINGGKSSEKNNIQVGKSSEKNKIFDVVTNGFTNTFPPIDVYTRPYLKRKILPVNMEKMDVDEIYYALPNDLKANSISEVKTIIQIWRKSHEIGKYTDNTSAFQNFCVFKIIDYDKKLQIRKDSVSGSLPESSKRQHGDVHGTSADKSLIRYIKELEIK